MTFMVTIDIRCDWCGKAIAGTGCGIMSSLIPLDEATDAAFELEQKMATTGQGQILAGPAGRPSHLCRACSESGHTPRRQRPGRTPRPARRRTKARTS